MGIIDYHCPFLLVKTTVDEIHKGQFEFLSRSSYQWCLLLIHIYTYIRSFKIGSDRQKLNVAPNRKPNRIIGADNDI